MNNLAQAKAAQPQGGALVVLAQRLNIDPNEVQNLVINTLMKAKNGGQVTNDELVTFLAIASEYKLNPLTKEIYAFSNRGAIQPIVSIDGWLKIINTHPQFDGMEFVDHVNGNGQLDAVTCKIYRKDRARPTEVTEYMNECAGTSDPWKKWPARMLRHKSTIQCARYAFGLSGIVDPDEADRIESVVNQERDISPTKSDRPALGYYPQERFDHMFAGWEKAILSGKKTNADIIAMASTKGVLTEEQLSKINSVGA